MRSLQKMGGFAALYEAAAYIIGMVGFLLIVNVSDAADPVQQVALMAENQTFLFLMHLVIYVVWGVFMVILSLALYERIRTGSPALTQTATVFGILWACVIVVSGMIYITGMEKVVALYATDPAQAATVWLAIDAVFTGLGGGNEILGGIWILLISWAALKAGEFSKTLNYIGAVIGFAGIISVVPALSEAFIYIFALGQIVWFIWLGIVMLGDRDQKAIVN